MRNTILAIALLIAGCAHNYADALAREASPGADRLVFGDQGVLVHDGDTILACFATAGRTQCHVIADWSKRPDAAPQPNAPKAAEPPKPDASPAKPEAPKVEPPKPEEKPAEKKPEPKPAEKKK